MELANKQSKSILAKLLATENVTVEHGKYNTASFDVKNRVLRLPIWKEMSGNLYDLLVLHEVGHALFTPEEGMHDAKGHGRGFKSFLNVVEDARIERKIKVKYPGGRRSFIEGYSNLMERDFFGLKDMDISGLGLIDKINLHYKVGDHVDLTFSDEESVFLDRIDKANTWKEVVKICEDLYEYAKENESETDMSDHDWENSMMDDEDGDDDYEFEESEASDNSDSDFDDSLNEDFGEETKDEAENGNSSSEDSENGEGEERNEEGNGSGTEGGEDGEFEPESKTDHNFRNNESELISDSAKPYRYINLPNKVDLKTIIIPFSEIYEEYREMYSGSEDDDRSWRKTSGEELMTAATEKFKEFRGKNKKVIEYLAKEFELKKAAKEHARTATANSGILDSERLYTYKYNEHIFKKLSITPDGKNHGLVMFVDWSGSMSRNMKGTIEQMMTLVMFCKRVNIPFEVYAFSDSYTRRDEEFMRAHYDSNGYMSDTKIRSYGTVALNRFNLLNLFSSRMRAKELQEAFIFMMATSHYYTDRYRWDRDVPFVIPDRMNLGGTPLNSTLFVSFSVMREFQKKNQVDVINSIFLTDGDSHSASNYWISDTEMKRFDPKDENVIIRDSVSKKQIKVERAGGYWRSTRAVTSTLVKFQRDVFDINIVNFFIMPSMRKYDMMNLMDDYASNKEVPRPTHADVDGMVRKFRKDKYMIFPEYAGFNEQYFILGGKNLEVEDTPLEVTEGATVAQMARAFKKFSTGKLQNRKLLSRFIDMVAA